MGEDTGRKEDNKTLNKDLGDSDARGLSPTVVYSQEKA